MSFKEHSANLLAQINDISTSPIQNNFLRPNGFRLVIQELPGVAYNCQAANLPDVQLGYATRTTPFQDFPITGDKLVYGSFDIRFLVTETMANYMELYRWMVAIGFPSNYNQFSNYSDERITRFPFNIKHAKLEEVAATSDATLSILDSNNNPKINVRIKDMFPVMLGPIDLDVTTTMSDYIICPATFRFKSFDIETL